MERFTFLRAMPWFEEEPDSGASGALRTAEHDFATKEIFEGVATLEHAAEAAHGDASSVQLTFRASLLASSRETRVRVAMRAGSTPTTAAGSKRRRDGGADECAASLLLRFESGGRALQGRLLHTMVERLTENVTESPPPATEPPYLRFHLGAVNLILQPLPELDAASGTAQLRRVVERMLDTLPRAAPRAQKAASAEGSPLQLSCPSPPQPRHGDDVLPPDADDSSALITRTAHWQAFVRCARQLADRLLGEDAAADAGSSGGNGNGNASGNEGSRSGGPGGLFGGALAPPPLGDTRAAELLTALPVHYSRAMPISRAAGQEAINKATATAAKVGGGRCSDASVLPPHAQACLIARSPTLRVVPLGRWRHGTSN